MKQPGKRILGVVCALSMLAAMMPSTALAAEPLTSSTTVLTDQLPAEEDGLDPAGAAASGAESGSAAADSGTETTDTAEGLTEGADEDNAPAADAVNQPADAETPADVPAEEQPTAGPSAPAVPDNSLSAPVTANGDTAPGIAPLVENAVAKIGDTEYQTLDAAVEAAQDGATIELLADAVTDGLNLKKDLTIQAAAGLSEKPTLTFVKNGIALWGKSLTFKDLNVAMNGIGSTPYTAEWNWMTICASKDASLTLNNTTMTMDATGVTNSPHAIYFCSNNKLNVENGSVLTIKNYPQDALEWDGGDGGYNVNITDSTFVSDHNRSGFTGTFYATITNSNVDVINSSGNGSNGSHYIIQDNSKVNFSNNGSHGLSAGNLTVQDSTVTCLNNGLTGIIFTGTGKFIHSDITISGTKGISYWNAGLRLYNASARLTVDKDTKLTIQDNFVTGIFMDSSTQMTIEDGADVLITGNEANQQYCSTAKDLAKQGGGLTIRSNASATLSASTQIYNNHAALSGDDIYLEGNASLVFRPVGSGWTLDDCKDAIDGWYYDEADNRWTVHDSSRYYAKLFTGFVNGTATVSGPISLKAAHSEAATLQPADITIYMGGEGGYDGVVDEDGTIVQNNSLPEPGYYITLSDEVNAALQAAGLVDADNTPVNLSDLITVRTVGAQGEHVWHLQKYGNTYSAARGKYIYAIVPEEGTDPFRLTFRDGETLLDEDSFVLSEEKNLQAQYDMDVYSELVNARQVFLEVSIPDKETYYCNVSTLPGILNVRYVTGTQDSVVTPTYTDVIQASAADNPDKTALDNAYVIRDPDTKFYINKSDVDVTEGEEFAHVSLLFDDIVSSANTEGVEDYKQLLTDKAVQAAASGLVNVQSQAKYLDLVDANNGNV